MQSYASLPRKIGASVSEIAEQQEAPAHNARPVAPAEPAAASDDLDGALAEYEAAVPQAEPGEAVIPSDDDGDMQKLAADALAEYQQQQQQGQPDNRLAELQGENAQLRHAAWVESEKADFGKFTADIQTELPEHLPTDYAETQLMAAAAKNPELAAAWELRNSDRRAVDLELSKVERALAQLQNNPAADRKKVAALMQYGYRLGLAYNSREILKRARADIVNRGREIRPIDPEATADYEMVAQAVRGAGGKVAAEPAPDLSKMSDAELRKYTQDNYGFSV